METAEIQREQLDARSAGSAAKGGAAEPPPEAPNDLAIAHREDGLEDVAFWPYWV